MQEAYFKDKRMDLLKRHHLLDIRNDNQPNLQDKTKKENEFTDVLNLNTKFLKGAFFTKGGSYYIEWFDMINSKVDEDNEIIGDLAFIYNVDDDDYNIEWNDMNRYFNSYDEAWKELMTKIKGLDDGTN